ncbi:MAG: undecaprenyl-diphosphate phosphatase [Gammaproteobacteria bacterium]|nr:undecaprenyl-diphosphate phosphatase [Gammaproteobacteria bacterium]MBV8975129.1 undecaprenyl-diphosphate phosphatase [Nevskiaceae bacterium]MBV9316423.1 undecaprenyl-diphosphate phosphatase [Gammaproteobacteria bacterium]MBV9727240.1 undecaprenyl-diphosphate phosphatase [Gammaproteobacteria bacterium]
MTDTLNTVILGIVEGITEFLPISSTGHLLIAERWLGERSELFNVAIQAGAILAIVLIYRRRLWALVTRLDDPANRDYLAKLLVAFLITATGGFIATRLGWKLPESLLPIALATLIGGVLILIIEAYVAGRPQTSVVTWNVAVWVGACQILAAVFPGTSRSASTIFAAMLAGLTLRPAATEFAFLVGIPTMFAATGYELLKTRGQAGSEDWNALLLGFVVSLIVAFIAVKWLLRYVQSHRFTVFAWYRIALGSALLALIVSGTMH